MQIRIFFQYCVSIIKYKSTKYKNKIEDWDCIYQPWPRVHIFVFTETIIFLINLVLEQQMLQMWTFKIIFSNSTVLISFIREGNGTPLQYSCLENPMDGGAWWATVYGVAGSRTRLSDFTFTFHFHALEKEMATHSSVLAWRIPETGEPGGLLSMGSHRVGHDWSNLAAGAAAAAVFYCVYIPYLLYLFLCWWTLMFLPYLGYCE